MKNEPVISTQTIFAAATLLKHADALSRQIEGVRGSADIEYVHRMRVASRRLGNALHLLEDFLPQRKVKKWLKQTARVTRALRQARDLDVQIDLLQRLIEGLAGNDARQYRPGIERLALRLIQKRATVQDKVIAAMDRLESCGVIRDIRRTMRAVQVKAQTTDATLDYTDMHPEAAHVIEKSLEHVLVFEPYVRQPEHINELHQMRIAVKRLRYTLEAYAPVFGSTIKSQIKLMRSIQTMLGQIHDCDVWIALLPQFLEEERGRFDAFFGHHRGFSRLARGVNYLLADRKRFRQQLHHEFVSLWDHTVASKSWDVLSRTIQDAPDRDSASQEVSDKAHDEP